MQHRTLLRFSLNDVVILEDALLASSEASACFETPELRLPLTFQLRPPSPAAFDRLHAVLYRQLIARAHGVWEIRLAEHHQHWCAGALLTMRPFVDATGAGIEVTLTP